jgi:translation initiation factor 2 subunit 2
VNFQEICDMMKRSPEHVTQFVLAEFGTEGSNTADGQLILKGRYQPKHIESLLRKYIKDTICFVTSVLV